jgi:hypothetical protein
MNLLGTGWATEDWAAVGSVVQAVATILTLGVAVVAARYAARQVHEAEEARKTREAQAEQAREESDEQARREQRLREEQARPFVVVDFEPSSVWGNAIDLVFRTLVKLLPRTYGSPSIHRSRAV